MDAGNQTRASEGEELIVTLDITMVASKALTPVLLLAQTMLLDHGAHRTVEDEDASGKQFAKSRFSLGGADGS